MSPVHLAPGEALGAIPPDPYASGVLARIGARLRETPR
jgi:hypothetical protein